MTLVSTRHSPRQFPLHAYTNYRVPKKDLVSVTQVLLQTGRLKIARALPHAELLARELMNFRSRVTAQAVESQLDWRERANDDLVLALAIATWQAERNPGLGFSCSYGSRRWTGGAGCKRHESLLFADNLDSRRTLASPFNPLPAGFKPPSVEAHFHVSVVP